MAYADEKKAVETWIIHAERGDGPIPWHPVRPTYSPVIPNPPAPDAQDYAYEPQALRLYPQFRTSVLSETGQFPEATRVSHFAEAALGDLGRQAHSEYVGSTKVAMMPYARVVSTMPNVPTSDAAGIRDDRRVAFIMKWAVPLTIAEMAEAEARSRKSDRSTADGRPEQPVTRSTRRGDDYDVYFDPGQYQ